jgi:hypothetical protein
VIAALSLMMIVAAVLLFVVIPLLVTGTDKRP